MNRLRAFSRGGCSPCSLLVALLVCTSLGAADIPRGSAPIPVVAIRGAALAEHEEPLPPGAIVRIGSTRFRHPVQISDHWFSSLFEPADPDKMRILGGRYLVTTLNTKFTLNDVEFGSRVLIRQAFDGPTARGWIVPTISPDGRRLAITDFSWETRLIGPVTRFWELQNDRATPLKLTAAIRGSEKNQVEDFDAFLNKRGVFSADGREFYQTHGKHLSVYDPSSGKLLRQFSTKKTIVDIAPNGGRFLATNANTSLFVVVGGGGMIFNTPHYRFRPPAPGARRVIPSSPPASQTRIEDLEFLLLDVHDLVNGRKLASFPSMRINHSFDFHGQLSPNGKYLCGDFGRSVLVWDVDRRLPVLIVIPPKPKNGEPQDQIGECRFSDDGRLFYATISNSAMPSDKRTVRCFDLKTGKEVAAPPRLKSRKPDVDKNGVIRPRDPKTGRTLPLPPGYAGVVMETSPDARLIAIGDWTGRIDIWSADGRLVRNLCVAGPKVLCLSFSQDGKRLAASDQGREVRIWSAPDWRMIDRFDVPADSDSLYPDKIAFSPDGRGLLIYSGEIMAMWNLRGRSWIWDREGVLFAGGEGFSIAFSPDGNDLVYPYGSVLRRIDARNGKDRGVIRCDFKRVPNTEVRISAMASSPDAKQLATVHAGHDIQLVDANAKLLREFPGSESIESRSGILRFSPDGRRLATCDDRGRAYIWETATGTMAYTLEYPEGDIQDLRFGGDSRTLITSDHREAIVWSLRRASKPPDDAKACWNQLTNFQAAHAESARWRLLEHPEETVRFLKQQLPPTQPLDQAQVRQRIAELNAGDYRRRERASAVLRSWGRQGLKSLRAASDYSAETRRRLTAIIQDVEAGPTAEERRQIRAVEIAELIGTADAWLLIESWSKGEKDSVLTEEAAKALSRHVTRNP